jgi:hypothetical protein
VPKIVSLAPPMEAAAGLTPNRATMVDIRAALTSAPSFMKSLGLSKDDVAELGVLWIGKGHYAHVFALHDGRILKVTDDADDATAAELIRRAVAGGELLVGLPYIDDVKRFRPEFIENETDDELGPRPLFAIVSERVVPMKKFEALPISIRELLGYMAKNAVWTVADAATIFRGEYRLSSQKLLGHPDMTSVVDQVMQGVKWLDLHGISVRDLHERNFGTAAGGRAALFDFGHNSNIGSKVSVAVAKNGRSMPHVRAAFDECFDRVERDFHDFGALELHEDQRAGADNGHGSERQFGYCMDGSPIKIAFAAKTEDLPIANIRGLMAHEFGHALDYRYGKDLPKMLRQRLPDGVERRADAIAKAVFGRTIKYDSRDIQCVQCEGVDKRPRRLGP